VRLLGEGNFSVVRAAKHRLDGVEYAIKRSTKDITDAASKKQWVQVRARLDCRLACVCCCHAGCRGAGCACSRCDLADWHSRHNACCTMLLMRAHNMAHHRRRSTLGRGWAATRMWCGTTAPGSSTAATAASTPSSSWRSAPLHLLYRSQPVSTSKPMPVGIETECELSRLPNAADGGGWRPAAGAA
jgi:hypothetical protein